MGKLNYAPSDKYRFGQLWQSSFQQFETDFDFTRDLPLLGYETVYTRRESRPRRQGAWAIGKDAGIGRFAIFVESTTSTLLDPAWGVITIPIAFVGETRINGADFLPDDVFVWNRPQEYVGYGINRDAVTVGYRKQRLCAALSALAGTEIGPDVLTSEFLQISSAQRQALLAFFLPTMEGAFRHPTPTSGFYGLTDFQQAKIIDVIASNFFHDARRESAVRPATSNSRRVVESALEAFRDGGQIPTVSALCRASGVGVTTLHRAFLDIYGVSPAQYILNKRLSAAREMLLLPDLSPRSVKNVALSLGFEGSGRFAQYYKRAFGELPGETLRRNSNPG